MYVDMKLVALIAILACYGCHVIADHDLEEEINECERRPDGLYPTRDFSKYLKCTNTRKEELACENGHVFMADRKMCIPKNHTDLETFCHSRPNGDYMNPWSNCSRYIHCVFGWSHVRECQDGFLYEPESDTCVNVSNSPHCSKEKANIPRKKGSKSLKVKRHRKRRFSINREFPPDTPSSPDSPFSPDSVYPPDWPVLPDPPFPPEVSDEPNFSKANDSVEDSGLDDDGNPIQLEDNLISPEQLKSKVQSGNVRLIDVRQPWELASFGKIDGSINVPLADIKEAFSFNDPDFKTKYVIEKPSHNDCDLVFYCQSGVRSYKALLIAKSLEYSCPKSLRGGFKAWLGMQQTSVDENPEQLPENLITPEQLKDNLGNSEVRLIDVREPWEIEKFGKIGHSVNIPVADIKEAFSLSEPDFKTKYGVEKPSHDDCDLVFHCQSGVRSYKALLIAKSLGYSCAKSLKGGHNAWKEMEDSLLSDCENTAKTQNENTIVTPQQLKEKLEMGNVRLIDVRENWEIEKYGKIAQSVNIPVNEIETAFRMNDEEFKNRYSMTKPVTSDCDLVFHCQSGIRSCKAVVMVTTLGYKCPKSLAGGYKAWEEMTTSTDTTPPQAGTDLITSEILKHRLQNNDVTLIDVREKWELDTEGKIAQSINIPLNEIEAAFHMNDLDFKSKYGIMKPGLYDCDLVFHCKSGVRSYEALQIAKSLGYTCAKSLAGGFTAWKNLLL